MKTEQEALRDIAAQYDAAEAAQRTKILAEQNALVNLQAQRDDAVKRVRRFFAAVSDKSRVDPIVAAPPDEVQDDPIVTR